MFIQELIQYQIQWIQDVPLKEYTTLHIGGPADVMVFPKSIHEIELCLELCQKYHMLYDVLGKGSNILALDQGYQGVIINLSQFREIRRIDKQHICVQSGATLKRVCDFCLQHELTGLEFACGIPGTIGGAVYMNAGAYGGEMQEVVEKVVYLDENGIKTLTNDELDFSYRHSFFTEQKGIILEVTCHLQIGNKEFIKKQMSELMKRRYEKQPMSDYSAGSTFKRPEGHYASALIRQCGLQGFQIGGAQVSLKHAGFLINCNNATSHDFLQLINHVQKSVYEQTGYQLECEIKTLS